MCLLTRGWLGLCACRLRGGCSSSCSSTATCTTGSTSVGACWCVGVRGLRLASLNLLLGCECVLRVCVIRCEECAWLLQLQLQLWSPLVQGENVRRTAPCAFIKLAKNRRSGEYRISVSSRTHCNHSSRGVCQQLVMTIAHTARQHFVLLLQLLLLPFVTWINSRRAGIRVRAL